MFPCLGRWRTLQGQVWVPFGWEMSYSWRVKVCVYPKPELGLQPVGKLVHAHLGLDLRDRTQEPGMPGLPPCQRIWTCIDDSLPVVLWMGGSYWQEDCWETLLEEALSQEKGQREWWFTGGTSLRLKRQFQVFDLALQVVQTMQNC